MTDLVPQLFQMSCVCVRDIERERRWWLNNVKKAFQSGKRPHPRPGMRYI